MSEPTTFVTVEPVPVEQSPPRQRQLRFTKWVVKPVVEQEGLYPFHLPVDYVRQEIERKKTFTFTSDIGHYPTVDAETVRAALAG